MVPPWEFNVPWNFQAYPTGAPTTAPPCITAHPSTIVAISNSIIEPNRLLFSHGRWTWRSCTDGLRVTVGGQLGIGTVFSRILRLVNDGPTFPPGSFDYWASVEAWAKYRVDDTARLSAIQLAIDDLNGVGPPYIALSGNVLGFTANNDWHTVHAASGPLGVPVHADENLRLTLTFLGTTAVASVGEVNVDVEWFAIRLRGQVPGDP